MKITGDKTLVFTDVLTGETYEQPLKKLRGATIYVKEHNHPHVYDEPYDKLYTGGVGIKELDLV